MKYTQAIKRNKGEPTIKSYDVGDYMVLKANGKFLNFDDHVQFMNKLKNTIEAWNKMPFELVMKQAYLDLLKRLIKGTRIYVPTTAKDLTKSGSACYFARDDNYVKVGRTTSNVASRTSLKNALMIICHDDPIELEIVLHGYFNDVLIDNETFNISQDDMDFIKSLAD